MRLVPPPGVNPTFPLNFTPLAGTPQDCSDCGKAERVGFDFDYAYQPIVDVERKAIFAHEALVRGPNGEGAYSVLSQVNEVKRYRFDQAIVRSLVRLCEELNIQVVAEGIETLAERDFLHDAGIRLMQGYLFAKPAFRSMGVVDAAAYAV